jgi:hypothetical protein
MTTRNTPAVQSTQIFFAATQYAAATVTAAIRAGLFGSREGRQRLLVVSNTSAVPELSTPLDRMAGFEHLRPEFDAVHSWNQTIHPHHPAGWTPRVQDTAIWERALRLAWDLGDGPVEVACESIQANPSRAVASIFADSPIHVYADGLMSYGPTRNEIPMSTRITRLLHLDLVPGLRPLLLSEYGVASVPIPNAPFLRVLAEIGGSGAALVAERIPADDRPTAVLLGQYLSALDLITPEEEEELHIRMLRGAVKAGHSAVLFKPHPSAPARYSLSLEQAAGELGVRLTVLDAPVLAETLYEYARPELVVGCFSTALMTAATFYGIPVARVGTELLLNRIAPYPNSNRIPLTIVDHLVPDLESQETPAIPGPAPDTLAPLLRAVGYCMQPEAHSGMRDEAESWLRAGLDETTAHYFATGRLTTLGLPGGKPLPVEALRRNPVVRKIARKIRAIQR